MVNIDKEKCIGCGMCIKDCFPDNLFINEGKAESKGRCMQCGHCIAVCPVNASSVTRRKRFPNNFVSDSVRPLYLLPLI